MEYLGKILKGANDELGAIMDELKTEMQGVSANIQASAEKQDDIIENTGFLSTLYDAIELKKTYTKSASGGTLEAYKQSKSLLGYSELCSASGVTMAISGNDYHIDCNSSGTHGGIVFKVDVTDLKTLKSTMYIDYASAVSSKTGIGLNDTPNGNITTCTTKEYTGEGSDHECTVTIDVTAMTGIKYFVAGAYDQTTRANIYIHTVEKIDMLDATESLFVENNAYYSEGYEIPDGELSGALFTIAPADIEISRWDTIAHIINANDGEYQVDIVEADTLEVLVEDIADGANIADLVTDTINIAFAVRMTRAQTTDESPKVQSLAVRYIS